MNFHKVSTAQVIELPSASIIVYVNYKAMGKIAFHFFQLQSPYAIGTIYLQGLTSIALIGSLQQRKQNRLQREKKKPTPEKPFCSNSYNSILGYNPLNTVGLSSE